MSRYEILKRYQQTDRGREITRNSAKKYWQTERGREVRKRYLEKNAEQISEYQKKYQAGRREWAKKVGVCMRCRKYPVTEKGGKKLAICEGCRSHGYMRLRK